MSDRLRTPALATPTLALALVSSLAAQHPRRMALPDPSTVTLTAESDVAEIPFRRVNNHLILPVSVNGSEPLDVVLDTGMPAAGLAVYGGSHIAALGLDVDPSIQARVGGAGGDGAHVTARIALEESLSLPGLEIAGTRVIVLPEMPELSGYHDGIIGYSLFGRFVVEIDYDASVLRLHEPGAYRAPADAVILPLALRHRLPYATVTLTQAGHDPFDAEVVVDLGASHAISLNRDHSPRIVLPAKTLSAVVGRGVSGPVRGEVGRLAALGLGGARLEDVVATFPVSEHQNPRGIDSLAGNLGSDVLRRFNTTFDYAGERMILVPNRSRDEPFTFDRSGIRLVLGHKLVVEDVIAGSPAAEAGVEIGDVVTHVDGEAVSAASYGEVRDRLMGSGEVRLTLERGERTLERTIRLRRLI